MTRPEQPGEEFFQLLRERYTYAMAQDAADRADAEEDMRFAAGGEGQWAPGVLVARKVAKRPILTENRLTASIAQVCNDGRQNKPSIRCTPKDGGTPETAEYYEGRMRQIQYESDADIAYDTSREQQVTCGRGAYRLTTKPRPGAKTKRWYDFMQRAISRILKRPKASLELELVIEPIENQFAVLWDPSSRKYDHSDAEWCLVLRLMTRKEHDNAFGENTDASLASFYSDDTQNPAPEWMGVGVDGAQILVGDYYVKSYDDDGECTVTIYVTNGVENHDETEWLDDEISVYGVYGKQAIVDGVKHNYSLIRHSKDPQRLVNLYVSNIAEQIAMMPKNPYLIAEGQIAGREGEWATMNTDPRVVQQYKRFINGQDLGVPQRNANEPPIQALVAGYLQAIDAVKAGMGIFDSSLGANKDETSGIAIKSRQKEGDITTFHFPDNEARTRKALGRALLKLIPIVDGGAPGEKPVRGEDGKVKYVPINKPFTDDKTGKTITHDMTQGEYEPWISSGASYTSQRDEAFQIYSQIAANDKNFMSIAGDLLFRSMDAPFAEEIADRYQKMLPPQLQEHKQGDPAQIQHQAQMMGQQIQQLTAMVHQQSQQLETKAVEAQAKIQTVQIQEKSKMDLAQFDRATKLMVAEIETKAQSAARAAADGFALQQAHEDMAHDVGLAAMAHRHKTQQADQAAATASDAADQNAANASDASAQNAQQTADAQAAAPDQGSPSGTAS